MSAALAAGALPVMIAPWQAYQTWYDPPGNRLLKWHLAGVIEADNRSVLQAIYDSYSSESPGNIARYKLRNLGAIIGKQYGPEHFMGTNLTAMLRDEEFRYVIFALGLFNLAWIALLFRRVRRRLPEAFDLSRVRFILAVAGSSMLIWAMLIFSPGNSVTLQGSYATMMLIFVACAAVISTLPSRVVRTVLAFEVAYFAVIWVVTVWAHHHLHPLYVGLSVLGGLAVLAVLSRLGRTPAEDPLPAAPPGPVLVPAQRLAAEQGAAQVELRH